MRKSVLTTALAIVAFGLSSCGVHKVVTVPVKGVYNTTKFVGKTAIGGTKLVGKGLWATGKGVYYIGSVPVKITDAALDTTAKVLTITTQTVDLAGKVVTIVSDRVPIVFCAIYGNVLRFAKGVTYA